MVVFDDHLGLNPVDPGERVDSQVHHARGGFGQLGDAQEWAPVAAAHQIVGALSHVHGEVAEPLEVGHYLQTEHHEAQVGGHRLPAAQQAQAGVVDVALVLIHLAVTPFVDLGAVAVDLQQGMAGVVHHLFDPARH